ncbi:hypothetical protein CP981_06380 [Streptomyces platensis]|uniref:Uncharacterized protein n=1 Tax=Streptomyces platensis TaxID=58346 RepID=A0AAE6NG70_STRPT|nr:hypothetical protein CP981_06380 [Streptomyces platensis]
MVCACNDAGHEVCSPRPRGWSRAAREDLGEGVVVPAHAGLVPPSPAPCRLGRRGPRACGVGPGVELQQITLAQWSPRVRGCSHAAKCCIVLHAHAGLALR